MFFGVWIQKTCSNKWRLFWCSICCVQRNTSGVFQFTLLSLSLLISLGFFPICTSYYVSTNAASIESKTKRIPEQMILINISNISFASIDWTNADKINHTTVGGIVMCVAIFYQVLWLFVFVYLYWWSEKKKNNLKMPNADCRVASRYFLFERPKFTRYTPNFFYAL